MIDAVEAHEAAVVVRVPMLDGPQLGAFAQLRVTAAREAAARLARGDIGHQDGRLERDAIAPIG